MTALTTAWSALMADPHALLETVLIVGVTSVVAIAIAAIIAIVITIIIRVEIFISIVFVACTRLPRHCIHIHI